MDQPLADQVAWITGAGRGIGRAIAVSLAEAGALVVLSGRSREFLQETQALIQARQGYADLLECDVTDEQQVHTVVQTIQQRHGAIQVLVNNAGITASVKFTEMDRATWDRILQVNVTGPFHTCRAVVPAMIQQRYGRIVNIASIAGLSGLAYSVAYSASKHGLIGLTRSLALELARHQIYVNAVCPGWVATEMFEESVATIVAKTGRTYEQAVQSLLELSQQPRVIQPAEIGALTLALVLPTCQRTGEALPLMGEPS